MAQMMRFKRHPFDPDFPDYALINPEHIVQLPPLGGDTTIVVHIAGSTNVAHLPDEVFYAINNNGDWFAED